MVDAAIGGKNGVDIGHVKNQIGIIRNPIMTLIDFNFLKTLDKRQVRSGAIEMFKHGLIYSTEYWKEMLRYDLDVSNRKFQDLISESIKIKAEIVESDPTEQNNRKALNYGHTIGHAIESLCLEQHNRDTLLHGEAVAAGLYAESYLSKKHGGLPENQFKEIESWYFSLDFQFSFNDAEVAEMIQIMSHDKKNVNGEIRFVLVAEIGQFITDVRIPKEDISTTLKLL
jgi:3-dehydroquinate synthase